MDDRRGCSDPAHAVALALAADVLLADAKAPKLYRRLKFRLVGGLPDEGWVLTESRIRDAIEAIEQERVRGCGPRRLLLRSRRCATRASDARAGNGKFLIFERFCPKVAIRTS